MRKFCCFTCSESDLPDIDVNVSCPSTCCVRETKSHKRRKHGRDIEDGVLQPETSGGLCLNSETSEGDRSECEESQDVAEGTTNLHPPSLSS